jgi:hypothetical protein
MDTDQTFELDDLCESVCICSTNIQHPSFFDDLPAPEGDILAKSPRSPSTEFEQKAAEATELLSFSALCYLLFIAFLALLAAWREILRSSLRLCDFA